MPPAAAVLVEELIEEVLVCLPPGEPASLFRACLVSKLWCRLISGPRFRRRYREHHRTPPVLGFFCGGRLASDGAQIARFVLTSAFGSPLADRCCRFRLLDARHGRVLLVRDGVPGRETDILLVWDPVTDIHRAIPMPKRMRSMCNWKAAVVCDAATAVGAGACDHSDCHRGHFLVVLVISYSPQTSIWTYSSDAGSWSKSDPIFVQQHGDTVDPFFPSVLVGNALYFEFSSMKRVLKYDLEFHEMSVIGLPHSSFFRHPVVLTTTADGRLGLATIHELKLYMWSRTDGAEADAGWTRDRVIELETLLFSNAIRTQPVLVSFVDRIGAILIKAYNALFIVYLKTSEVKKVWDGGGGIVTVVPYMSFYTPALGASCTSEGPSADGSSPFLSRADS